MKNVKILCVCGSGTVSSAMVANKLKDELAKHGYAVNAIECSPNSVETSLAGGGISLIACISPVFKDYGVPKVNAVGMLTGLAEQQVIDDCLKILDSK